MTRLPRYIIIEDGERPCFSSYCLEFEDGVKMTVIDLHTGTYTIDGETWEVCEEDSL